MPPKAEGRFAAGTGTGSASVTGGSGRRGSTGALTASDTGAGVFTGAAVCTCSGAFSATLRCSSASMRWRSRAISCRAAVLRLKPITASTGATTSAKPGNKQPCKARPCFHLHRKRSVKIDTNRCIYAILKVKTILPALSCRTRPQRRSLAA